MIKAFIQTIVTLMQGTGAQGHLRQQTTSFFAAILCRLIPFIARQFVAWGTLTLSLILGLPQALLAMVQGRSLPHGLSYLPKMPSLSLSSPPSPAPLAEGVVSSLPKSVFLPDLLAHSVIPQLNPAKPTVFYTASNLSPELKAELLQRGIHVLPLASTASLLSSSQVGEELTSTFLKELFLDSLLTELLSFWGPVFAAATSLSLDGIHFDWQNIPVPPAERIATYSLYGLGGTGVIWLLSTLGLPFYVGCMANYGFQSVICLFFLHNVNPISLWASASWSQIFLVKFSGALGGACISYRLRTYCKAPSSVPPQSGVDKGSLIEGVLQP